MPFAAKSAAPYATRSSIPHLSLERAAAGGNTMFVAPPGYLLTEHLMAVLSEGGRPIMWLRFGSEDHDPATLLLSLIGAAQRLCPGAGMATLEQMRRQPGPLTRWPPLFAWEGEIHAGYQ